MFKLVVSYAVVAGLGLVLVACGEREPNLRAYHQAGCPDKNVAVALRNLKNLRSLQQGADPERVLRRLEARQQRLPLVGPGQEVWEVRFYPVGVPTCPHLWPRASSAPVVVDGAGRLQAVGRRELERLEAKGWQLRGMVWDWGSYDYAYLPMRQPLRSWWW